MIGKDAFTPTDIEEQPKPERTGTSRINVGTGKWLALCACAFVACFLLSVGILHTINQLENVLSPYVPFNSPLTVFGSGLLHVLNIRSLAASNMTFTLITMLEFALYGIAAWLIQRIQQQESAQNLRRSQLVIWIGTILAGVLLLLTPAMISHDIFAYATYGHIIINYHANPFFVVPSAFPHEPLLPFDDWKNTIAAYGPVWMGVCVLMSLFGKSSPLAYIFLFRAFALLIHLINAVLVMAILRAMGSTRRVVVLGTLLYAWNPLLLLEAALSGHNDLFMITFMLFGILLCVRAEQHGFARARDYVLPIIVFALAVLVKYSALPLVCFYLVLLVRKSISTNPGERSRQQWQAAVSKGIVAAIAAGLVVAILYGPFFIGHSLSAITASFTSLPSNTLAAHSLLNIILEQVNLHSNLASNALVHIISSHKVWNDLNTLVLLASLLLGAIWLWRKPDTRTAIFATLLTLDALLIVTPWLFPWYVTWVVGLAAIALPPTTTKRNSTFEHALLVSTLVFSATARFLYLYIGNSPSWLWDIISFSCALVPPLCVFFFIIMRARTEQQNPSDQRSNIRGSQKREQDMSLSH